MNHYTATTIAPNGSIRTATMHGERNTVIGVAYRDNPLIPYNPQRLLPLLPDLMHSPTMAGSLTREEWLHAAAGLMTGDLFKPAGYVVPRLHVSVSFPWRPRGSGNSTIGQCFDASVSADGLCHLFIHPQLNDTSRVCDVLAHEIVHAVVGVAAGHKRPFAECATAIGLTGHMTATVASDSFKAWVSRRVVGLLGPYPHPKFGKGLTDDAPEVPLPPGAPAPRPKGPTGSPKQTTRLLKATCPSCGYTVRVTKLWADRGLPRCSCPDHKRFELA